MAPTVIGKSTNSLKTAGNTGRHHMCYSYYMETHCLQLGSLWVNTCSFEKDQEVNQGKELQYDVKLS